MPQIKRLLFVCIGNICRSPMAEAFFRHLSQDRPAVSHIDVSSAGTIALDGNAPSSDAVEVMRSDYELDISGHRAQRLLKGASADLILTMDAETTTEVSRFRVRAQVEMLGDYVGTGEDVDDPYGESRAAYRQCAQQLHRLVDAAIRRLESNSEADPL